MQSLTLKQEWKLRVSDNRVLRKIFGPKRRSNKDGKNFQFQKILLANSVAQEPEVSSLRSQQPATSPILIQLNPIHTPSFPISL
jgi:hypothetical protein